MSIMTVDALLERGKTTVSELLKEKWGRMRWYLLNPAEKHNYYVCWAAGYVEAMNEYELATGKPWNYGKQS